MRFSRSPRPLGKTGRPKKALTCFGARGYKAHLRAAPEQDTGTREMNPMITRAYVRDRDLFYWAALSLAPGIGAQRFGQLVRLCGSPRAVFEASAERLSQLPKLPRKSVDALTRFDWGHKVEQELERAGRLGIDLVTLADSDYPALLKEIACPPPVLWVGGSFRPDDVVTVAIVGSRAASDHGVRTSYRLAGELASAGAVVVSGAALGIDAAAHRGALDAGGRTYGVLGCGVDVTYPRTNRDLYGSIPESGALVSEFPLGTEPRPGHFPVRNRIIAGLSMAVVVVEAGQKSGALITARLALDENRDVLAVPGRAGSAKSRGAHELLRQGARLVENGRDVLEEVAPQLTASVGLKKQASPPAPPPRMSDAESIVWEALGNDGLHVDALGRMIGQAPPQLATLLLEMELRGLVRQMPGQHYVRTEQRG